MYEEYGLAPEESAGAEKNKRKYERTKRVCL